MNLETFLERYNTALKVGGITVMLGSIAALALLSKLLYDGSKQHLSFEYPRDHAQYEYDPMNRNRGK